MAKWIDFVEVPAPGVMQRWEVRARQGNVVIGWICWSTGWRRYVLQPRMLTDFEQECLRDIANFIEDRTRAHQAARARLN